MPEKKEKVYAEPRIARSVDGTGGGGGSASGGGMTVGNPVIGGGANRVLFTDAAGNLKTVAQFAYVETTGALVVTPSALGTGILVQGSASPINGISNLQAAGGLFEMGIASGPAAFTPVAVAGDGIIRHSSNVSGNGNTIFINNNSALGADLGNFIWSTGALGADTPKMVLTQLGHLIVSYNATNRRIQFGGTILSNSFAALDSPTGTLIRAVNGGAAAFVNFAALNLCTITGLPGTNGTGCLVLLTGVAPTTSPADVIQLMSQDSVAGQANAYIRNEAGQITRLSGLSVRTSAQFDKTSDTTLADVTGLTLNVEAGRTYIIKATLFTTSNVAGGVKAAVGGTATATTFIGDAVYTDAATLAKGRATALATAMGGMTAATVAKIEVEALLVVNAAGTITIQFAQNASNGAASSVLVGSYMTIESV